MAMRPPGLRHLPSVARRMSERDRDRRQEATGPAPDPAQQVGSLLDGIRAIAEKLAEAAREGGSQGASQGGGERTLDIGGREGRMVFGYSIRSGLDGVRAEPFGDVPRKPAKDAPAEPAARTPITDLFEEADAFVAVVELPGAAEEEITLAVEDGALLVRTTGAHAYAARIALPGPVDAARLARSLRNGILEVRLPRAGSGA